MFIYMGLSIFQKLKIESPFYSHYYILLTRGRCSSVRHTVRRFHSPAIVSLPGGSLAPLPPLRLRPGRSAGALETSQHRRPSLASGPRPAAVLLPPLGKSPMKLTPLMVVPAAERSQSVRLLCSRSSSIGG